MTGRALREAEQKLGALKAEQEKLHPQVQEQAEMVPGLKQEYEGRQRCALLPACHPHCGRVLSVAFLDNVT